jgi:hypothetical protein
MCEKSSTEDDLMLHSSEVCVYRENSTEDDLMLHSNEVCNVQGELDKR